MGYVARTWPGADLDAVAVLLARILAAGLFALVHLSLAQRRR